MFFSTCVHFLYDLIVLEDINQPITAQFRAVAMVIGCKLGCDWRMYE